MGHSVLLSCEHGHHKNLTSRGEPQQKRLSISGSTPSRRASWDLRTYSKNINNEEIELDSNFNILLANNANETNFDPLLGSEDFRFFNMKAAEI